MLYTILDRAHSGLRWVVLLLLIAAIATAFQYWKGGRTESSKVSLLAMVVTHIQLLLGLILYFISPYVSFASGFMKNAVTRFYAVEHISMMLLAIAIITIGYVRAKKHIALPAKGKTIFWYYLIGLVLILAAIPWPFRAELGGSWF
jgi:hypothetical protein